MLKALRLQLIVGAACLALPTAADAAFLTIDNPSFESPATNPGTFRGGMTFGPADWTVYNTGATNDDRYFGVWNPSGTDSYSPAMAPNGSNIGVVFLDNTTGIAEAGLQQTLGSTLQLSTQYTLTVQVGNFDPGAGGAEWDFTGFPGYRVELLAGGAVLATDNNTLLPAEGQFLTAIVSASIGGSHPNAGQPLGIRLVNLNGPGVEVNFDMVRLEAIAVPEPSSAALLVAIGAALAAVRHRPAGIAARHGRGPERR